ncbi:uncharacterized protein [Rutidosis leptorrhynchoides]|uniref:uncharacterized protein n=1 Tax=Rutidosis leptorrhynchoides TaxID=125765 RepID=UPI003A9A5378
MIDIEILDVHPSTSNIKWISWIPKKINLFIWRLNSDRIRIRSNLTKRSVNLDSTICPLCLSNSEDVDHLFTRCRHTIPLWRSLNDLWNTSNSILNGVSNDIRLAALDSISKTEKCLRLATHYVLLWLIWKWRNKMVHATQEKRSEILNEDIMSSLRVLSHLWISNRSSKIGSDYEEWMKCPRSAVT